MVQADDTSHNGAEAEAAPTPVQAEAALLNDSG